MSFPGITNHVVPVPGTSVTCYLAFLDVDPDRWLYSLWTGEGDDEEMLSHGELNLSGLSVKPGQVARVAFLMDVEYAS